MGCTASTVKPSGVPISTSIVVPDRSTSTPSPTRLAVEDTDQLNLPPGTCVIAIDFGTSRSAFAYGFTGSTDVSFGCPTDSLLNEGVAVKAETCVILDKDLKATGFGLKGRKTLYAQKKEKDTHMFKWFKMHLKDIQNDSDESVMIADHNDGKYPLMTVITQALYYIAKSALDEVNAKSLGNKSMTDVYWAVTVPAIWSAAASGFMRRAAHKAGLIDSQLSMKLTLVREPEAACLDLLNDIDKKSHPVQIPVGAEIVVLDLGGGTNDMTFVKILSEDPLNCQELKEAAGGTGGAARIDQCVMSLLKELFGDRLFKKIEKLPALLDLMDSWETFKLTFDGHMTYAMKLGDLIDSLQEEHPEEVIYVEVVNKMVSDYNLHRPPSERLSNVRLKVDIPEHVVCKWFDSVVDVIIRDLDTELRHPACARINFLYLVGGFSSSKYLTHKVTEHCKTSSRYKNIVIFPATKPDVAIVRGAVRSLLSLKKPLIADHVASKAYGIQTTNVFDSKRDDRSKIVKLEGVDRVRIFDIFVCKGDRIPLNYVTAENIYTPLSADQENVYLKLYTLADTGLTKDSIVYMDDTRLRLEHSLKVPINKAVRFADREVKVKLKFGLETQILARDEKNRFYEHATCESFV